MKSINLICKLEIESSFDEVVNALKKYTSNNKYDFVVNICTTFNIPNEKILPNNFNILVCENNKNINNLVSDVICDSTQDFTVCCALNDRNWEHKVNKIIENLDINDVEICKVTNLFLPKNIFFKIMNIFIKLYYCLISILMPDNRKRLDMANCNFQGFSQEPVKLMSTLRNKMFYFRCCDAFYMFKQKNLFLKKNNQSKKINHLKRYYFTPTQILGIIILAVGLIFIVLSFPLLYDLYKKVGQLFKFTFLNILTFIFSFSFSYYLFFKEEIKKLWF